MGLHIAIEGIDGVGKTTAAKAVAGEFGFVFVEKALQYLFDDAQGMKNYITMRDYFNNQPDRFLSAWFYGLGNLYVRERFKGQNIVTDRHLLSNYTWSGTDDNIKVYDLLVKRIGAPDFTFILYAGADAVTARIRGRDVTDKDVEKTAFIPVAYEKMETFCKRYDMPYEVIDTGDLNAAEVAERIIKTVRENVL